MTDFRALCAELLDELEYQTDWSTAESLKAEARAALADGPAVPEGREPASVTGQPSDQELLDLLPQGIESGFWLPKGLPSDWVDGEFIAPPKAIIAFARDVLELWGNRQGSLDSSAPQPPVEGEVAELVDRLRRASDGASAMGWEQDSWTIARAAELLQRLSPPQPVPVSERLPVGVEQALIKAECALSDIAEGEPEENEGDADTLLQWAEQRAATALSRIRPVMRLHGILTSEWPPLPAHALPVPGQEVE